MPKMESDVYAALVLRGQALDPDKVSRLAGIAPSQSWRVGDLRVPQATIRHNDNGWFLKSEVPASASLEEHVRDVLRRIEPAWPVFVDLGARHTAVIECVVWSYGGDRPAITFTPDIVRQAAELHAAIDVDLYVLSRRPEAAIAIS